MDTTQIAVTVYDCPRAEAHEALRVITDNLTHSVMDPVGAGPATLVLGDRYVACEAMECTGEAIAKELREVAPGATFEVVEEGNINGAGSITLYTPALGSCCAEADNQGDARFSVATILGWLSEWESDGVAEGLRPDAAGLRTLIRERTGEPYRNAMQVPEHQTARQALRVVAGLLFSCTTPYEAHALAHSAQVDLYRGCAACDEDRKVRPEGARFVHVDTGRRECDTAVILHRSADDPLDQMPATLLAGPDESGYVSVQLPSGATLHDVPGGGFSFEHTARPVA